MKNEKKIIIIPDVHCRTFWKDAIKEDFDKIIFLGDYVDPYPNEFLTYDSLQCLNEIIQFKKDNYDKCTLLIGNHDAHYIWEQYPVSTRKNLSLSKEYHNLFINNLDLFKLIEVYEDIVYSHAGFTQSFIDTCANLFELPDDEISYTKDVIEIFRDTSLENVYGTAMFDAIEQIGYIRGGSYSTGGILWGDVREMLIYSPKEIFQIFGHTQLAHDPIILDNAVCLDCRNYFTLENNTLTMGYNGCKYNIQR